jgi:hypothetical protein
LEDIVVQFGEFLPEVFTEEEHNSQGLACRKLGEITSSRSSERGEFLWPRRNWAPSRPIEVAAALAFFFFFGGSAAFFEGVSRNEGLRELDASWNALNAASAVRGVAAALRSSTVERMVLAQVREQARSPHWRGFGCPGAE